MAFDFGSVASGASEGAKTGATFGGGWGAAIGGVIGGITGGIFGSRSKKKKKTAERLAREVQAINRYQARKNFITEGVAATAASIVAGQSGGFDPEGTSSAIGMRQAALSATVSGLKTEGMVYGRNQKIQKALKKAGQLDNTFSFLKQLSSAASSAKTSGMFEGIGSGSVKEIDMSTIPARR